MGHMVGLLIFVGCILAFMVVLFWYGLEGESEPGPRDRDQPALSDGVGPTGPGSDIPPYLPDFTVSEAETFRRNADRRLRRMFRPPLKARSWMDEPGALEAAGLVDAPAPAAEPAAAPEAVPRRHRRKKHH